MNTHVRKLFVGMLVCLALSYSGITFAQKDTNIGSSYKWTDEYRYYELILADEIPLTVFLVNGSQVKGELVLHTAETLILDVTLGSEGDKPPVVVVEQLIYKHAITHVVPEAEIGDVKREGGSGGWDIKDNKKL